MNRRDFVQKPINSPASSGTYYEAVVPDTLDLAERAGLGLNHFLGIIREEAKYNYEMPFRVGYRYPSILLMALVGLPCTQPKAMEAMAFLRLMTGSTEGLGLEAKMMEMMVSTQGADGLFWVPGATDETAWREIPEPFAYLHGQGRMLRAMIAWHQYTGDPAWEARIDRLVEGLNKMAVHKEDYAYFPVHGHYGGSASYQNSCYTRKGWRDSVEPTDEKAGEEGSLFNHQGHMPGALATWYQLTGNEEALRLSGKLVRFLTKPKFWADWQKGGYPGVVGAEHAHWRGHFHGHLNTLRAILEYALATNDSRLKDFVRDGYEWMRQMGFARIGFFDPQGCGTGRVIGLAVKLTKAGIGDYWEDVDQYIRNYGIEAQVVPEDMEYVRQAAKAAGFDLNEEQERLLEKMVGGFNHIPIKHEVLLCCSPHGNMGLFYAWEGMLGYDRGVAQINLLLNRASPWVDIDSYLPYEGKVVLRNKTAREAFVRMPLWVDRKAVRCTRGNT